MSYDYNALLEQIRTSRAIIPQSPSVIEDTLNHFTTLSTKCPMTPLLWMQYAYDAGYVLKLFDSQQQDDIHDNENNDNENNDLTITCQILELGIAEFPGCAMLRLYHLDCVLAKDTNNKDDNKDGNGDNDMNDDDNTGDDDDDNDNDVKRTWDEIVNSVCFGCHGGCDEPIIIALFNTYTNYLLHKIQERSSSSSSSSQIAQLLFQRADIFMKNGNDAIRSEMNNLSEKFGIIFTQSQYETLEQKRQFTSQHMSFLGNLEDDVLIAMNADGIMSPPDLEMFAFPDNNDNETNENGIKKGLSYDWNKVLKTMEKKFTYLMGFGMVQTSTSFIRYTQSITQQIRHLRRRISQELHAKTKAKTNARTHNDDNDMDDDEEEQKQIQDLVSTLYKMIISSFERGIAECPTVEIIWEKYIKHLFYVLHDDTDKDKSSTSTINQATLNLIQSLASRAVRNCPYSVKLFSLKMAVIQEQVKTGIKVLEPDELSSIVNEAIEGKFLPTPESNVDIFMAACDVVKQKILDLVSKGTSSTAMPFDEAEQMDKNHGKKRKRGGEDNASYSILYNSGTLDADVDEEVRDLIDDLREMYDEADKFIRGNFKNSTDLRERIFRERSNVEAYICMPLLSTSDLNSDSDLKEVIERYEKTLRIHQPPHPDSWRCYIRFLMGSNFNTQTDNELMTGATTAKFRYIRSLYHRAMTSTKKQKRKPDDSLRLDLGFNVSLKVLCQDFLDFENSFGSTESKVSAKRMAEAKLALIDHPQPHEEPIHKEQPSKTLTEISSEAEQISKQHTKASSETEQTSKQPTNVSSEASTKEESNISNVSDEIEAGSIEEVQKETHKIWIGKLQYPAHPFTIHVANLSTLTEDMDLYDLFRAKCGAIVHVRIFREKQYNTNRHDQQRPKSKCTGLIQFEERESVKKALALNGEIGLHEKLIKVTRSHQPAVNIVPPGMHRVQPKGQGKNTKFNQKRKERRKTEKDKEKEVDDTPTVDTPASTKDTSDQTSGKKEADSNTVQKSEKKQDSTSKSGILTFRPRGVAQKKRKQKLAIDK